jgi:hypothetical protein
MRKPSYPAKKWVRSDFSGPPSVAPNWFCEKWGSSSGLVKSRASKTLLRRYSYTVPCSLFVPDFVTTLTWPVPAPPSSAVYVPVWIWNSRMLSGGRLMT